ncbi:MAG TPA: thioredoxin [Candidatus Paceibacterota bacterium]|nr:thioredoxin [Candidatus Paceibacterota bacterium]
MSPLLTYLLIGGSLGALLGYFGKCSSGGCPLTANWRRGAIYGAVVAAAAFFVTGGGASSAEMNQSTANVKHITQTDFDAEVTQAKLPVVVDCYATWCGPCRRLAPVMDKLADQFAGKIKFVKVNVDESPKLAQRFNIEGIPMLLFFKNGRLVNSSVGLLPKEDLILRLETLLQTNAGPVTSDDPAGARQLMAAKKGTTRAFK